MLIAKNMATEAPRLINEYKNSQNPSEKKVLREELEFLLEKLKSHPHRLVIIK